MQLGHAGRDADQHHNGVCPGYQPRRSGGGHGMLSSCESAHHPARGSRQTGRVPRLGRLDCLEWDLCHRRQRLHEFVLRSGVCVIYSPWWKRFQSEDQAKEIAFAGMRTGGEGKITHLIIPTLIRWDDDCWRSKITDQKSPGVYNSS